MTKKDLIKQINTKFVKFTKKQLEDIQYVVEFLSEGGNLQQV